MKPLLTLAEAAEVLGIEDDIFHELLYSSQIPLVWLGISSEAEENARVDPEDISDFIQKSKLAKVGPDLLFGEVEPPAKPPQRPSPRDN